MDNLVGAGERPGEELFAGGFPRIIDSLERASRGFATNDPDAVEFIRETARELKGNGKSRLFAGIFKAATALDHSSDDALAARLQELLAALREAEGSGTVATHGILVIDDDPLIVEMITANLATPDRRIIFAGSGNEAEAALRNENISLIIMDLALPDTDGRDFLEHLHAGLRTSLIPVIILSDPTEIAVRNDCFARGANDFFEKPVDPIRLASALQVQLERHDQAVRDLRIDALTGLPNRAAFHEAFKRAASLAERSDQPLSIGIIDLDRFAAVNEAYGYQIGDDVLRQAANLIKISLRQSDFAARWGGQEFAIFFPETDTEGATRALEKMLQEFNYTGGILPDGRKIDLSFAAGVTGWARSPFMEKSMFEADHCLTLAKNEGGGRIVAAADRTTAGRKRILVGDDDEMITSLVKHRLEREGYEVVVVGSGADIISTLQQQEFSLLLLDVKMPSMDGFEVLERIRAVSRFRRLPIVMLTAMDAENDVIKGIELGANDYIVKPFSLLELQARIHRLLK